MPYLKNNAFIIVILSLIIIISIFSIYISTHAGSNLSIGDYTAYPPFISQPVQPNVLIILDNSADMYEFAYKTPGKGSLNTDPDMSYKPSNDYYGYFDNNSMYKYEGAGRYFQIDDTKELNRKSFWSGNFLNWLTMRKIDIVRKVLIGGKTINRASVNPRFLVASGNTDRDFWKSYENQLYRIYSDSGNSMIQICDNSSCSTGITYNIKIYAGHQDPTGIIQNTSEIIRYGLMFFNLGDRYEDGINRDGGYISVEIGGELREIVNRIEDIEPSSWTPLGEALYESIRYFEAINSAYNNGINYSEKDPIQYPCQKNFVLIITDGESTKDRNLPGTYWSGKTSSVSDPYGFSIRTFMEMIASNEAYSTQWGTDINADEGTLYLEGMAYYAHTSDLRSPDKGKSDIEGFQNLSIYTVYVFGNSPSGKELLKKTAKYGAFKDKNENNKPDLKSEWDADGDDIPDAYFEVNNGEELEASLVRAIGAILNQTASGTSTSVASVTGEGEGAIYQAYFYPERFEGLEERRWLGCLHALFLDPYGNIREDTNENGILDFEKEKLHKDLIIEISYDPVVGVSVKRFLDEDGDGKADNFFDRVSFDEIHPLWDGGKRLWEMSPEDRKIYTTINGYELERFHKGTRSSLRPYLRASDENEAEAIIEFIRGVDNPVVGRTAYKYRERSIKIGGQEKVWKLGDIVYSTPTVVSRPMENYDLLYGDQTYFRFRQKYIGRRHVIYAGANDGMLHAFNGGFYDIKAHGFSGGGKKLGEELWAFIPRELLPHLKWLTYQNYSHVYYVDLKPKIADVRIFADDNTHPNGWGTILISGMRYGGKSISTEKGSLRSTYFAIDITDPEDEPRLLWTFDTTDSGVTDLGLSMSYPAVAKVGDEWYVIFGSGPYNFDIYSNPNEFKNGRIFVLKISGEKGIVSTWVENKNYWKIDKTVDGKKFSKAFMSSPTAIDVNNDYSVDAVYIGVNYINTDKEASMLRLTTQGSEDVSRWNLSELYTVNGSDLSRRINISPSIAFDNAGQLWIYFGTGQFLGADDRKQSGSGAFYGIKENCWDGNREGCPKKYSNLFNATNVAVYSGGDKIEGTDKDISNWSQLLNYMTSKDGWAIYFEKMHETYDNLSEPPVLIQHRGEMVITKPSIISGIVTFTTYIPESDLCKTEGKGNIYMLFYGSGTAYKSYIFKPEKIKKTDKVSRTRYLGYGLPSSTGFSITKEGQIKGFVQVSTGNIYSIEDIDLNAPRSSYIGWKAGER
ncbi:MAG: PilC/PilY family type IV pilus protein [Thermodesulfovibrionales bacterium]